MAQIRFAVDINTVEAPLLYDWAGRTVMQPQADENAGAVSKPQALFYQDVLPTVSGYKSVSYKQLINPPVVANLNFTTAFEVTDAAQNRALIGITSNSKIYMITGTNSVWTDVTPVGWTGGDKVTVGAANGTTYLYLYRYGCYAVNITGIALTPTVLTGITAANINGITSAMNYLVLWDDTTLYWSSTLNPLDFVPSLITGAGSQIPNDMEGKIVKVLQLNNGFAIYSTANIVLASYSNNTQYPWIFRNANNGSGIASASNVTNSRDLGFHVALTYAGMMQVTPTGCEQVVPEVTEFLIARTYESYNTTTNVLSRQILSGNFVTKLALIAARYIILSYGITELTDALVYDITLKRWGKLHSTHTFCFELESAVYPNTAVYYNDAGELGATYAASAGQPYSAFGAALASPPDVGKVIALLAKDGSMQVAYLEYALYNANGVLLLGKYQALRNHFLQLSDVIVDTVPSDNGNFKVLDLPTLNGKDLQPAQELVTVSTGVGTRHYKKRVIGLNHTLAFVGSFNITSAELIVEIDSRR